MSRRTARGLNVGVALSLLCHFDTPVLLKTKKLLDDEKALQPYAFKVRKQWWPRRVGSRTCGRWRQ